MNKGFVFQDNFVTCIITNVRSSSYSPVQSRKLMTIECIKHINISVQMVSGENKALYNKLNTSMVSLSLASDRDIK